MDDPAQDRKQRLSPARRALLEERMRGLRKKSATPRVVDAQSPGDPIQATPMQRLLWAFAQSNPDSAAYHMHRAVRLSGTLNIEVLQSAIDRVVARHDALRTVFTLRNRELVQEALPSCKVQVTDESSTQEESVTLATAALRQPFDLATGPLLRIRIFRESPTQCLLLLVVHHIVADEWSLGIVWHELCEFYAGATELPPPSAQFTEVVRTRQSSIQSTSSDDTAFWVEQLRGLDFRLDLPVDRARPPVPRSRGAFLRKALSSASGEAVQALATAEKTTPFAVLLALYGVLLARWTGRDDLCLGIPAANRADSTLLSAVGLFLGAMPFRSQFESGSSFRAHLTTAREQLLATLSHQQIEQEQLAHALAIPRESGRAPLFQTMFVAESDALAADDLSGLIAKRIELDYGAAKFDTSFFVNATAEPPSVAIEYDTDLFDAATADRLLDAYGWLLEQVLTDPDRPIDDLTLIRDDERGRLLDEFGPGPKLTEEPIDVLTRIRNMADSAPNRIAVRAAGQSLSYQALIERSTSLAHRLVSAGAGPSGPVGLYLDRSTAMVVGVVASLMANAVYVPLDPSYPAQRLRFAVDDLAAAAGNDPIIVAQAEGPNDLGRAVRVIHLTETTNSSTSCLPVSSGEDLAYVIYTSGSTGRPKGVAVTRANLAASTAARIQTYGQYDRFLLLSSFAFDSSVAGLFGTLTTGGTLVIANPGESRDPRAIARLIRDERVTHTLMLPSLWNFVLKSHEPDELETMQSVVVAGEACDAELVRAHHACFNEVALYNEYGPTEATVWATVHPCVAKIGECVPIGRPIPGARAYILDAHGKLTPMGFVGELHVGGPGVAQGYWQQADPTAERFVKDPFDAAGRIYRTGDRARFRDDGTLEFLGRADDQIKVRGHRIEPGEVEACLATHLSVADAGVAPHPADPNRLVALVRLAADQELDVDALREHALAELPESVVPATFAVVTELPRLANGKLDRRRLANLLPTIQPTHAGEIDSPGDQPDALETALAEVWAETLQIERVSLEDDFFHLGGHSLLGVQLLLDVKARFGIELALADLFETPRLRGLAQTIREHSALLGDFQRHRRVVSPVQTGGSRPPLFCIHAPALEISATLGADQPVYLVYTNLSESKAVSKEFNVRSLAEHFVRGIREIQPTGPYHLFGYSFGAMLAYEMGLQLQAAGESVAAVGMMDPTLAPSRLRVYMRLDALRRAEGLAAKVRYLFDQGPGIVLRRFGVKKEPQRAPSREEIIRRQNMRRYVELAGDYQYVPSSLPCQIIVPEVHPTWLRWVRRFWNSKLGESAQVEVIIGSREHMDLVRSRCSVEVLDRFRRFLDHSYSSGAGFDARSERTGTGDIRSVV